MFPSFQWLWLSYRMKLNAHVFRNVSSGKSYMIIKFLDREMCILSCCIPTWHFLRIVEGFLESFLPKLIVIFFLRGVPSAVRIKPETTYMFLTTACNGCAVEPFKFHRCSSSRCSTIKPTNEPFMSSFTECSGTAVDLFLF